MASRNSSKMNTGSSFAERRAMFSNSTPSSTTTNNKTHSTTITKTSYGTVNGESKLTPLTTNGSRNSSTSSYTSQKSLTSHPVTPGRKISAYSLDRTTPDIPVIGSAVTLDFQLPTHPTMTSNTFPRSTNQKSNGDCPVFRKELKCQTCSEGDPVTLRCTLQSNSEEPTVTWYKDGRPLSRTEDIRIIFENSVARLKFSETTSKDSGSYKCEASNSFGTSSTSCTLTVTDCDDSDDDEGANIVSTVNRTLQESSHFTTTSSIRDNTGNLRDSANHQTQRSIGSTSSSAAPSDSEEPKRSVMTFMVNKGKVQQDSDTPPDLPPELPPYSMTIEKTQITESDPNNRMGSYSTSTRSTYSSSRSTLNQSPVDLSDITRHRKQSKQERIEELIGSKEPSRKNSREEMLRNESRLGRAVSVEHVEDIVTKEPQSKIYKEQNSTVSTSSTSRKESVPDDKYDRARQEKMQRLEKIMALHDTGKIDLSKKGSDTPRKSLTEKMGSLSKRFELDKDSGAASKPKVKQEKLEKIMKLIEKHDEKEKKKDEKKESDGSMNRPKSRVTNNSFQRKLDMYQQHDEHDSTTTFKKPSDKSTLLLSSRSKTVDDGPVSRRPDMVHTGRQASEGNHKWEPTRKYSDTIPRNMKLRETKEEERDISEGSITSSDNMSSRSEPRSRTRSRRQVKPSFVTKPRRQFVKEGEQARFRVYAEGEPAPKIEWSKDNEVLTNGGKYKIYHEDDSDYLAITDVTDADRGQYTCTISNAVGTETVSANLDVEVKQQPRTRTRSRSVTTAPVISKHLESKTVEDGKFCFLECHVTGEPKPNIEWFQKGNKLNSLEDMKQTYDGKVAKLTFSEIFPEDEGLYECVATNSAGVVKSSATLTVEVPPVFTQQLVDQTVDDEAKVVMTCKVIGCPVPSAKWFKGQREIKTDGDFILTQEDGVCQLTIKEVYPEDSGDYTCVANNSVGECRTSALLTVKVPTPPPPRSEPPPLAPITNGSDTNNNKKMVAEFVKGLSNLSVMDEDKVELCVEVKGNPDPVVCWMFEDQAIKASNEVYKLSSNGNQHKLVIEEVYPEDAGTYVCEIYNDLGGAETRCHLKVKNNIQSNQANSNEVFAQSASTTNNQPKAAAQQPQRQHALDDDAFFSPEFIRKPKSVIVNEGSPAIFSCKVVANPDPEFWWELNGKKIKDTDSIKTFQNGEEYCLEFSVTKGCDSGRYLAVAQNSEGREQCPVSLKVNEVEAPNSSDFRDILKPRAKHTTIADQLRSKKGADQVDFRRVLTNQVVTKEREHGQAEQKDYRKVLVNHVKTQQRPRVLQEPMDVDTIQGSTVTIKCKLSGQPAPTVVWYHNKQEIKPSRFVKMNFFETTATLTMMDVYPVDSGEYLVVAKNEAGTASTVCEIRVQAAAGEERKSSYVSTSEVMEPPLLEDLSPDNVQVLSGRQFKLRGKYAGQPMPKVEWYKDKTLLKEDGRTRIEQIRDSTILTILEAEVSDTGIYKLVITNELGNDQCTSSVTVEDRPDPPVDQPAVTNITLNSMTLSWSGPSYDGGSIVVDYKVEMCKNTAVKHWKTLTSNCKHTTYQVKNLDPNTEYQFRVSAANKHGFSDPGTETQPIMTVDGGKESSDIQYKKNNEMTFEPKIVEIDENRDFYELYTVKEEIGKGRFGNVHKCIEKASNKSFAAKFIKSKQSDRKEARIEISIMNELHHPKLLQLWDAFESKKEMVIVTEHVHGGELFERIIDDDYILTERECIHFLRQICNGVLFMHKKNILHLDLKPENILCVTPNSNEIKIIDFGLARKVDPNNSFKVMFGTPEFIAPEVIAYEQVDTFTDMWSIGVITYILLSGLSPFSGDKDQETFTNVTDGAYDFDDEVFDDISENAKDFIENLLIKNKNKRLSAKACLDHTWLSQDVKFMRAKRLSTAKHKRYMARRKWQKTGTAIRALGRMAAYQKSLSSSSIKSVDSSGSPSAPSVSSHNRQGSLNSDPDTTLQQQPPPPQEKPPREITLRERFRAHKSVDEDPITTATHFEPDSGIDRGNSSDEAQSVGALSGNGAPTDSKTTSMFSVMTEKLKNFVLQAADEDPEENSGEIHSGETIKQEQQEALATSMDTSGGTSEKGAPRFLKGLVDQDVRIGDTVVLKATIEGDPFPTVMWVKDGVEITSDRRHTVETDETTGICSLTIRRCRTFDKGNYDCCASSTKGHIESSAKLAGSYSYS